MRLQVKDIWWCDDCLGSGELIHDEYDPTEYYGHKQTTTECETCQGTGDREVAYQPIMTRVYEN